MQVLSNEKQKHACSKCFHQMKDHFVMISGNIVISYAATTCGMRSGMCIFYCCIGTDPVYWVNGEHDDERYMDLCPCGGFNTK